VGSIDIQKKSYARRKWAKREGAWVKGIDNLQIPDWRWRQQYQTREFASSFKRTLSRATFINSVESVPDREY
jgi:hypothetical protein